MKRKLMICAMALCICAGLAGNTGEVSVWASEGSSSDAVRIGALKGPTAMGMAQLLDEDGYDFTIAASPDEIVPMVVQDKLDIAADRKSVVQGKSVDLGGRRIIKKIFFF